MNVSITLRSHLMGSLNDLVESANLGSLGKTSIICELVSLLVDYTEEGTSLFLDVFVTSDLTKLTNLIPESTHLRLGVCTLDESGVAIALKNAATLVRGCWRMYLSPSSDGLEFGLFRDSGHPLNVPVDLGLSGGVGDARFIRVTKLTRDAVRVATHDDSEIVVHFTNAQEGVEKSEQSLDELAELICAKIPRTLGQSTRTFLATLLQRAARESHGLLVAVINKRLPAFLNDCVQLNPPIDLSLAVEAVLKDASAIPKLHAIEALALGMFASDGIVVFDCKGRLLAYRAFMKLKASNTGGARRRAYRALCEKLGHGLKGAFFQSQDGATQMRRSENE